MKKKNLVACCLVGSMILGLTACKTAANANPTQTTTTPPATATPTLVPEPTVPEVPIPTSQPAITETPISTPEPEKTVISPLPVTIDTNRLENCTLAVSFDKGDAYVDDTGVMQLKVTVYTYDLYDMVDISLLKEGDIILLRGQEILVTSVHRTEYGSVQINGGLDMGGYELCTADTTVFFETGYSDLKSYYELGEVTLPVSTEFIFTDASDLDREEIIYYPGDFLTEEAGINYYFTPHNTSIVIQNGQVISMKRIYTP